MTLSKMTRGARDITANLAIREVIQFLATYTDAEDANNNSRLLANLLHLAIPGKYSVSIVCAASKKTLLLATSFNGQFTSKYSTAPNPNRKIKVSMAKTSVVLLQVGSFSNSPICYVFPIGIRSDSPVRGS
ncbi:hypothetical protein TRICI_003887 [Trichomonascus ciferrii]|uniref:Uncharacterized protein n=1 Tax=Trichomonascus ciferrii TaxID=44093 RepID=A0A642V1T3_9ASCO|nr:hypothetical protein TRICI_003887 [Trichomonascus ciferrii]